MATSLRVAEADETLKELAEGGHLEVRVRGGGLSGRVVIREGGCEETLEPGRMVLLRVGERVSLENTSSLEPVSLLPSLRHRDSSRPSRRGRQGVAAGSASYLSVN